MKFSINSLGSSGLSVLKHRRAKTGIGTALLMTFIGGMFLLISGVIIFSAALGNRGWNTVEGTVTGTATKRNSDGNDVYAPIVRYVVNGETYSITSNSSSSFMPANGSTRKVNYNPAKPADAKVLATAIENAFIAIFPVVGLGIILFAWISFIKSKKRDKQIKNLVAYGTKVQGVITNVVSSGDSRQPAFKLVVAATDPTTGSVKEYHSDTVHGLGGMLVSQLQTSAVPIDVYIDATNPALYYVDLADIPPMTPETLQGLISRYQKNPGETTVSPTGSSTLIQAAPPTTITSERPPS